MKVVGVIVAFMLVAIGLCANSYELDGAPTGLSSSAGPGTFANGTYAAFAFGNNCWAQGTASFKFKWVKSTTQPLDPPKSAIVFIQTTALAKSFSTQGSVGNGYEMVSPLGGQSRQLVANEYKVQSDPGESFTITVPVHATTTTSGGYEARVSVKVTVSPVQVIIPGMTWTGSPKTPGMLIGERVQPSLSAPGAQLSNFSWTIPGDKFKDWNPNATSGESTPTLTPFPASELTTASPNFHWKAISSTTHTISCNATASFPTNIYLPTSANVTDEQAIDLAVPSDTVGPLVASQQPFSTFSGPYILISCAVICNSGKLNVPMGYSGGSYAFVQVIKSADRSGLGGITFTNKLDGTFPYTFNSQVYSVDDIADFADLPTQSGLPTLLPAANDQFEVTLMFRPASPGASWVPVKVASWSWNASVTSINAVPGDAGSLNVGSWSPTVNFPTWIGVNDFS